MTIPDKIKWIADYFGIEMSEFDKKKLSNILQVEPKIIVKEIPIISYKPSAENKKTIDLAKELQKSCEKYGVQLSEVIGREGKGGNNKVVSARVYFARSVKLKDKNIRSVQLAGILKKDHSTILHYWYYSKAICEIPPIPVTKKKFDYV